MIKQMISLDPSTRPTFDTLLHTSRGTILDESFYSFLHNYVSSINDLLAVPPLSAVSLPSGNTGASHLVTSSANSTVRPGTTTVVSAGAQVAEAPSEGMPSDSDHRMERIWADYESVEPYLAPDAGDGTAMGVKVDYAPSDNSSKAFQVCCHLLLSLKRAI
jgi:phosphoinositide-3-kinase regulatory subunit 4